MEHDEYWMREAIALGRNCADTGSPRYSVGCIVVADDGQTVLATGFSGEDGGKIHAEELVLDRLLAADVNSNRATLYSSLEPCSQRGSATVPCAQRTVAAKIQRVVYTLHEPVYFPVVCEGDAHLRAAGVEVLRMKAMEEEAANVVFQFIPEPDRSRISVEAQSEKSS